MEVREEIENYLQTLAKKDFEAYEYRRFLIHIIQIFSRNNWERPTLLKVIINKVICGELKKNPVSLYFLMMN